MRTFPLRVAARVAALAAMTTTVIIACDSTTSPATRAFTGPRVAVGGGEAWTEMVFGRGDRLESFSVIFDAGALTNLPATLPTTEFTLPLPADAPETAYNHVGINWQPQGHPPPMVYTHPHFDVHYYLVTPEQRNAMTPADPSFAAKAAVVPSAAETPAGYAADPQGIPRMGTHWTDRSSHEFHGSPFTNTMVYGFYEGKMIFLEPMMTKAFLETQPDETSDIAVPAQYPGPGAYPTSYRVRFDNATSLYRVELLSFVERD